MTEIQLVSLLVGYVIGMASVYVFHLLILPIGEGMPIRHAWERMWGDVVIVEATNDQDSTEDSQQ